MSNGVDLFLIIDKIVVSFIKNGFELMGKYQSKWKVWWKR